GIKMARWLLSTREHALEVSGQILVLLARADQRAAIGPPIARAEGLRPRGVAIQLADELRRGSLRGRVQRLEHRSVGVLKHRSRDLIEISVPDTIGGLVFAGLLDEHRDGR